MTVNILAYLGACMMVIKDVVLYADSKIATTKKVVNK